MSMNIPTAKTQTERKGANKADYEKFVVVDTYGHLVEEGQVAYSIDLIKDDNMKERAEFLESLFGAVEMEFKVRTTQERKVKSVNAIDLMKSISKGN